MSVDIFGRQWMNKQEIHKSSPSISFNLTANADFDISSKRLCNVHDPIESNDAVTLNFLNFKLDEFERSLIEKLLSNIRKDELSYDLNNVEDIENTEISATTTTTKKRKRRTLENKKDRKNEF